MTRDRKNIHNSGALKFILEQGDIKSIDQHHQKNLKTDTIDLNSQNSNKWEYDKQNNTLKIIELSPELCKPWAFSDRHDLEMGNIEELSKSIQLAGQQEPILVRPITDQNIAQQEKYEVIFGNRRLRACQQINKNVLAIICNMNDQQAAIAQKEENENREDISDYSRALHYKKLITSGIFPNENKLSEKLNIPRNRMNDLMSYNRIPSELIKAIPNPYKVSQRLAIKLAFLSKDNKNLPPLLQIASEIGTKKITSNNIQAIIDKIKNGNQIRNSTTKIQVFGKNGAEIFTIKNDSNGSPCIVLHKASREVIEVEELKKIIKEYIDSCISKKNVLD